jgi:hypothetical protein
VQWSFAEDFSAIVGEHIIDDPRCMHFEIQDLLQGSCYYVRVSAWNVKGFSEPCTSNPPCATPSSEYLYLLHFIHASSVFNQVGEKSTTSNLGMKESCKYWKRCLQVSGRSNRQRIRVSTTLL